MWSVIRRRQGLEPNEAPLRHDAPCSAHQRCILLHAVRPVIPYTSPTAFSKAYGDFLYAKIRRWLLDERADVRLHAADHLVELYKEKREHCVQSLAYDMLPILLSTLEKDESAALRERAGMALELLVREAQTQRLLLGGGSSEDAPFSTLAGRQTAPTPHLAAILASLRDESDEVVVAALRVVLACHMAHNAFSVTAALVQGGLIPVLIGLIQSTNTLTQMVACSATRQLFQVKEAHVELLKLGIVATLTTTIIKAEAVALVAEAAEVASLIAEYAQGRRDAVACGTLASLLPHLHNANLTLRVAVYSAAAQITVLEAAKIQATEVGYPEQLVGELAREDERDVLMHMLRLIYNLAEWPTARVTLRECLPRIAELLQIADGDEGAMFALSQADRILTKKVFPA
ncbi:hypothetical protein conserved [Leishmania donovani]|uniref:Uncharacterized protein n=3 Tax=Leishmania donovani species complex TaxID=38574 RepID=A4HV37_LEIIN|nr:conserved hypothetical protein [Leishmania infantum JPCM5]XP_003859103.1 hypothetical protein, conserved [Leishmania donovani]CAC9461789.1 hypothetical_protein_-_conserved [Leishmania infantum]AYU76900.1 hypothetical protein LdCL_110018900 [Leishmania donovani]TPP39908.1 hypothetical protein CGC20_31185 [Leishmania donovani]TPP52974.1 hypothetical protein CGC21_0630 [Leishmania donovani]CAJ1986956.1 hypothetical protein conserved [Leishmania donovani]|eukprot:XP_001463928.1 conserved hypothetical protein [Leishmania infantum JPCM5]